MTREQKWARAAYEVVCKEKDNKTFGSLCKNGPSLLQRAGAAQAIGFWNRNDKDRAYLQALAHVWDGGTKENLLDRALKDDLKMYMALTRDLMSAAIWLRRFAQAEIADEETSNAE